jgi:hypothetical protein
MLEVEKVTVRLGDDEYDVEAEGHLEEVVVLGVGGQCACDASQLRAANDLFWLDKVRHIAGFDFNGHQFALVFEDQVGFSVLNAKVALEDLRPLEDQVLLGESFTAPTDGLS